MNSATTVLVTKPESLEGAEQQQREGDCMCVACALLWLQCVCVFHVNVEPHSYSYATTVQTSAAASPLSSSTCFYSNVSFCLYLSGTTFCLLSS